MKDLLEQVSIAMGYDGEINEQVDQWVELVANGLAGSDSNTSVTMFIMDALNQWTQTGYFPHGGLGVE